jgi:hypothetical protein
LVLQHDVAAPLFAPASHCSPVPSMTPLPQKLVKVTVTKWPSLDCVRPGMPVYSQAPQLDVVPFCSPWRTAASQELLRTEPFQVKVSA